MRNNLKQRKQEGFTIIEVLIVLAIAGLILLVVFMAVPALQRNARNTAIKSDVQALLGGISEFSSNNNGKFPTSVAGSNGDVVINNGTGAGTATQTTKISGSTAVTTVTVVPTSVPNGAIQVRLGARCDATASTRAVAAYYSTETSGSGQNLQCQDS